MESASAESRLTVGDVALHFVEQGSGPAILLLHGFPEFWYSWRRQLPRLAAAGRRAVAIDLRGYNQSDCPQGVANYRMELLVGDVARFIRALGIAPAAVVGHDWGGVIAWRLAARHPELVRKLVILNAPHPQAFRRELRRSPAQWVRSAYAGFFQLPLVPEKVLAARNFAAVRWMLRGTAARREAFSEADLETYVDPLRLPGRLTAALDYYRAARRYPQDLYAGPHRVHADTLVIWGEKDPALSLRLTEDLSEWAPRLEVVRLPNASHWVQHDAPEEVAELILGFAQLSGSGAGDAHRAGDG